MKPSKLPLAGACRCGEVRVEITAPPLITAACHCTGCQKMSASAFSLTAIMPANGFRVTEGTPVIGGLHGPELHHYHCPNCKRMFTRVEGYDNFVNVRPTMLDDHSWFSPFIETMTREKLAWAETPARHRFEGFPPMDEFGSLIEEYSKAG